MRNQLLGVTLNIERFHAIVNAVLADIKQYNYPERLTQLVAALQNRINDPQNGGHISAADNHIVELRSKLPELASNSFPPSWKEHLYEHGFQNMIGNDLLLQINEIIQQKDVTPTIAHKKLKELSDKLNEDVAQFRAMEKAFTRFDFGTDEPKAGEAEMGVLVPRKAVHNGLTEFGKELTSIARIVKLFQEITTGTREDPSINSISSSDLSVFFQIDPETALRILQAITNITEWYKTISKIKAQINELRKSVPEETLSGAIDHANSIMKTKIKVYSEEIITEKNGVRTEKRKNEVKIELQGVLEAIAIRVDKGYEFEVRAKPEKEKPPVEGEIKPPAQIERDKTLQLIVDGQKQLSFVRAEGDPILSLPGVIPEEPNPPRASN